MAYIYTPFMKKVLHITKRKRKSNVHHYCKSDDFRAGFKVAKWGMFCHSAWLQISPARFKQVYSDSTLTDPPIYTPPRGKRLRSGRLQMRGHTVEAPKKFENYGGTEFVKHVFNLHALQPK